MVAVTWLVGLVVGQVAIEALPEASLLAAGTMLFLLAGALELVIAWMRSLSGHVSLLGWHPLDYVVHWAEDARNHLILDYQWDFSHLASLFEWTVHSTWQIAQAIATTLDQIEQKAVHAAVTVPGELLHVTEKEIARAVDALVLPIEHKLDRSIGDARSYADHLVTGAEHSIDKAWQEVTHGLSRDLAGVKDKLGTIEKDLAKLGEVAGVASIAALAVKVATLAKEVEDCAVTTCNGPNNISKVLNDILGAASYAGEFTFLAAAIKDPVGTEQTFAGMIEDAWNAGHSLLDDLLSL